MCIPLASVARSPHSLAGFARAVKYTHVYLASFEPTVGSEANCSLFFDVQVMTLLLGKYTLFARANLNYPTTSLRSYFSTIFAAHLCVYTHSMGFKRSFRRTYTYDGM